METVSLLIGVLAGGVITSLIWIIINIVIAGKQKTVLNERNSYLNSIGEYIAEADSLLVSFTIGSESRERMKSEITRISEAIRKLYKPNIHIFEVFYVKYIDTLLNHYSSYLKESAPARNAQPESSYQKNDAAFYDHHAETVIQERPIMASERIENVVNVNDQDAASVESPSGIEDENEVGEILLSDDAVTEKVEVVADDDEFSIEPVSTEHMEVLPVEDADIPEIAPEALDVADLEKDESVQIASASVPQEQGPEFSFEEMAQDVMTVEDVNETGFSSIANKSLEAQVQQIENVENGDSEEEDFSMETIIDLDMSKIPGFNSDKSKITIKPQAEKHNERKPDDSEICFEAEKSPIPSQDAKKILPQSISNISLASNGEIKTPMSFGKRKAELPSDINDTSSMATDKTVQEKPHSQTEKENYSITGDDVADQIDSFFGFNK